MNASSHGHARGQHSLSGLNPPRRGWHLLAAAGLVGLTGSSALAQDALATVETESEMSPEVPNHPRGEREHAPQTPDAQAQTPETAPAAAPEDRNWFGGKPWWQWDRATGDWGGARTSIEDAGFTFGASYTFDWTSVWSGGVDETASTRSLFDATLSVDMEKLFGLAGGTVFVNFYSTDGRDTGAGDIQAFDNIATAQNVDQVAELWYEQKMFGDRLRVKFGKVDVNSEFGFPTSAGDFLHSSAAYSPTVAEFFPTYPNPATSLNVFVYPTEWLYVGFGLYDGAGGDGIATGGRGPATFFSDDHSSDWFLISEVGVGWKNLFGADEKRGLKGRAAVGVWHHTGDFDRFDGGAETDGTTGFYVLAEQRILTRGEFDPTAEDDDKGLWVFAEYGYADEAVSSIANHVGVGLALHGTFEGRDDDSTGVYVSWADLSDEDGAGFNDDETALEVYYKLQATPFISIRPDVQVIWNPSGDDTIDTTVVGGVRVEVVF